MQRVTDREVQAGPNTIRLAGRDLQVIGDINVQDLARFQSKITFGDYSHDSDSLLSTYIMSSFMGGIGNEQLKEGVDDETYWTGTLETRYPGMVTLLPRTTTFTGPNGSTTAYPLADFPASAPSFWAAFDQTLTRWDETDQEFTTIGDLGTTPVNKAVEYNHLLWIPLGQSGYATVDTGGNIIQYDDIEIRAFTLWDNKIAALTTDGTLRLKYLDTPWEEDNPALHLPGGAVPRNLLVFLNQQEEPTIHIITSRDVWAYDRETERLFRTHLQYPPHPDQGRASTVWRGESMYVSVGLGIHSYNGGIISAMGPDGRYGLPGNLRGVITDLEPEYNTLIALIEGEQIQLDVSQQFQIIPRQYESPIAPFAEASALSCVLRWTGSAWHPAWQAEMPEGHPTWAHVSGADGNYLLWWGYGPHMYRQTLPYTFHNPKAGMQVGVNEFESTGYLITGWFDADMTGFDKLASHCELVLDDVFGDGTPTGEVTIFYRADDDMTWKRMGSAQYVGRSVFPFHPTVRESSDTFSVGRRFRRIQFMLRFESDDIHLSPVMSSFQLKFIKLPLSQLSFRFTIRLDQDRDFMGNGPSETAQFVRGLASGNEFHELIHRNRTYRVRVAQTAGGERTGLDHRSTMVINAVEAPISTPQIRMPGNATPTP